MTASPGRPSDWPSLLASLRADPKANAAAFRYFFKDVYGATPDAIGFGNALASAADSLNCGILTGQGPHMGKLVTLLRGASEQIAAADEAMMRARKAHSQAVLACAVLSELGGHGAWDDLVQLSLERLWSREPEDDDKGLRTALTSLAWGHVGPVVKHLRLPREVGADPAPDGPFDTPWQSFRQMGRVLRDGAAADLASGAWTAYLLRFPPRLARNEADWNELMWAARAMHVTLRGAPVAQVPDRLLADIEAL